MTRFAYRLAIHLDRARDDDADFDDPIETATDEHHVALTGSTPNAGDARAATLFDEINAAIAVVLAKYGVERAS